MLPAFALFHKAIADTGATSLLGYVSDTANPCLAPRGLASKIASYLYSRRLSPLTDWLDNLKRIKNGSDENESIKI